MSIIVKYISLVFCTIYLFCCFKISTRLFLKTLLPLDMENLYERNASRPFSNNQKLDVRKYKKISDFPSIREKKTSDSTKTNRFVYYSTNS